MFEQIVFYVFINYLLELLVPATPKGKINDQYYGQRPERKIRPMIYATPAGYSVILKKLGHGHCRASP